MSGSLPDATGATAPPANRSKRWLRLALVASLLIGLVIVGFATGFVDKINSVDKIRALMDEAGAWGILLYFGLFALGQLVQAPGMVFVSVAAVAFGRTTGFFVAYAGVMISVTVSFLLVRTVGGKLLTEVEKPWMKKAMNWLKRYPFRTVLGLRVVFWSSPWLNYALAMSNVSLRVYVLGAALGLIPPVLVTVLLVDMAAS